MSPVRPFPEAEYCNRCLLIEHVLDSVTLRRTMVGTDEVSA